MKDVIINIKSTQVSDDNEDTIEFVTDGRMFEKDGKSLLSYDEGEMLGVPGVTTHVRIEDKKVVIQRSGGLNSRLVVEKEKRNLCCYETEHGGIMLGVFGEVIRNNIKDDGSLLVRYTLDVNCEFLSRNEIELKIREA